MNPLGILARLVLGGVWLVAGLVKLPDPAASVRAIRAYELLPEPVVPFLGYTLPVLEVLLGACLLVGLLTRPAAVLSSVLLLAFVAGIASAWTRGLSIECGCFGGGGVVEDAASKYPWEIARDLALLAASAWLVWRPRTRWGLDAALLPYDEPGTDADEAPLAPDHEGAR